MDTYQPPVEILKKYADVLVNYALNSGEGIKEGEVIQIIVPDIAKPLALELQNAVLKSGGHSMLKLTPTGFSKSFFELANDKQIEFFPEKYLFEKADLINHQIGIIADPDPSELKDTDPAKLMLARDSKKPYRDRLFEKENQGKFTWTLAMWGTQAKADIVGLSLEEYWEQIIKACYLDTTDPIKEWSDTAKLQESIRQKLNNLRMEYLRVEGNDMNITYKIGANRIWMGGSGRNIPSFELFTSPDWRGTEGWIKFNEPLYRYGNIIESIELKFKKGIVTSAKAAKGEHILTEMIKGKNANKAGEVSLTDKRMSKITHVMAETLFDENIGGEYGNHHMAVGKSYHDCYREDQSKPTTEEWEEMGFNDSAEHTDIISTTRKTATAILGDGTEVLIYENGQFII